MRVCPRCSAIFKAPVMSCSSDGTTLIDREDDPHLSAPLGRFILEALIAEGVTGRIYRSGDAAVRILYGDFGTQELIVKRMFKDIEVAKELQHPNVARILDAGTDDGSTWIAWELARGQTLDALVQAEHAISLDRVGSICAQIAAALAEAHEADILHRNLSPQNVMVAPKGKRDACKVLDFGLASLSRSSQAVRFRTRRDYAAPEALKPSGATKASDVYSLGLIAGDLLARAGNGKTELAALVAEMTDADPKKRPQTGRDVLSRLDDLGYSPIAFPAAKKEEVPIGISQDLHSDLSADGLVLVGKQNAEPEATQPMTTPDLLVDEGLVVIASAPAPSVAPEPTTTTYIGNAPAEATTREEIDIEESRKKLGFLETARPRRDSKDQEKEATRKSLLPNGPVVERVRPSNGSATVEISTPEPPTELMDDVRPAPESTNVAIEVTSSQLISEIEAIDSSDLEPVGPGVESDTEEQPVPLPGVSIADPAETPNPVLTTPSSPPSDTPAPTLLSAADFSATKAIGGVQELPAEHGERSRIVQRENPIPRGEAGARGFRPKGSWPTEDLVLPNKPGAQPRGFEDPRRVPTAVIRTRGVFSSENDAPDRPGLLNDRGTEIIRARTSSELSPRSDTLPIDRANTVIDPAEGPAGLSGEIRVKPRRSMLPLATAGLVLTVAAAAIALPRFDSDRDKQVRRPVLIQAQPDPIENEAAPEARREAEVEREAEANAETEAPPREVAANDPPPEADEPEEVIEPPEEKIAAEEKKEAPKEAPKQVRKEAPKERPKIETKSRGTEVAARARTTSKLSDSPALEKAPKKRERKKAARKRSSSRTETKKEQPDKLERGTLIDPFAE